MEDMPLDAIIRKIIREELDRRPPFGGQLQSCNHCYCIGTGSSGKAVGSKHVTCCKCGDKMLSYHTNPIVHTTIQYSGDSAVQGKFW